MKVHVSVGFLLVCVTFGILAEADPIRTKILETFMEKLIDESDDVLASESFATMLRIDREIKSVKKGLYVGGDDGELIEIRMDEPLNEMESASMLRNNIENRVFFRLYTRMNPTEYQPLWMSDKESLARSNFNAKKLTHFVTHGWFNSARSPACTLIRDAYLENDDFNVIVVDWSKISKAPYLWASTHVKMVSKYVAQMIDFLEEHANLNTYNTTLVGHSLGAHVMGLAGFNARGTINYIVGLDPAFPMFMTAGVGSRISVEDANHVQIIHTNAGLLGYLKAIGHTDFYPNGGTRQSGCWLDLGGVCSHSRSYEFFAESINTKVGFYGKMCTFWQFVTRRCKTAGTQIMGGLIDFTQPGKYFLSTGSSSPFAKGR